jgi:hypothetical protein
MKASCRALGSGGTEETVCKEHAPTRRRRRGYGFIVNWNSSARRNFVAVSQNTHFLIKCPLPHTPDLTSNDREWDASHGWNTYFSERSRSERIHWSKSATVGIPSVGDTSPFTVISSRTCQRVFGPRIRSVVVTSNNQKSDPSVSRLRARNRRRTRPVPTSLCTLSIGSVP